VRKIRLAAFVSALLGLAAAVPFNLTVPRTPGAWYQVGFGLVLSAASLGVAAHLRLARRVLVFLQWLAAVLSACGLAFAGVVAWTTGELPGFQGWRFLLLVGTVYYTLGTTFFGGLYLFFHSKQVVQAYGS
jgi:hypothetical protein